MGYIVNEFKQVWGVGNGWGNRGPKRSSLNRSSEGGGGSGVSMWVRGQGWGGEQMNKFENKSLCGHMSPSPWTGRPTNTNKTFPSRTPLRAVNLVITTTRLSGADFFATK